MALTRTTTTAAIKAGDTIIPVASTGTGFPAVGLIANPQQLVYIDNEATFLVQVPSAGLLQVRTRGAEGTLAVAHDINAPVVTSSTFADFPAIPTGAMGVKPWEFPDVVTYGQSGAIVVPIKDTKISFTGSVAQAMTLGAPSMASPSIELFITSLGAFAHTISAPSLFDTGVTGSPFSTATFPAVPGASLILQAAFNITLGTVVWNVAAINGAVVFT